LKNGGIIAETGRVNLETNRKFEADTGDQNKNIKDFTVG